MGHSDLGSAGSGSGVSRIQVRDRQDLDPGPVGFDPGPSVSAGSKELLSYCLRLDATISQTNKNSIFCASNFCHGRPGWYKCSKNKQGVHTIVSDMGSGAFMIPGSGTSFFHIPDLSSPSQFSELKIHKFLSIDSTFFYIF